MTENKDIRWMQRFDNYRKALRLLGQAVEIVSQRVNEDEAVEDLLKEGLIQRFEYTHELAWKVMKDYAEYQGYTDIRGSRDAFRKAFEMEIITDKRWMESIADRNLTSHNYDDETAEAIYEAVRIAFKSKDCFMAYGLTDREWNKLLALFASNERIEQAILYGSRAKDTFKPFSDVDITLVGADLSRKDLNQIYMEVDDLLLPYQFDLSLFHSLNNKDLIDHIQRRGIVIYNKVKKQEQNREFN